MANKLFGTDGIRGKSNVYPITSEVVLKLAQAVAIKLRSGSHRNKVVIGKDTRLSGYMLEPALVSGFISMGIDVVLVGPMPTPAIAMLTTSLRADLGVMISASHNKYEDNGIKLFAADGYKLSDSVQEEIEELMSQDLTKYLVPSSELGRAKRLDDEHGRYIEYLKNTLPRGMKLDGLKVVVDCANGAAYKVAPMVLYELGAEVIVINANPNGSNINRNCGATFTGHLQDTVIRNNADIGIALDGDADRLIICDEQGRVVDGDQIMGMIARSWKETGQLKGDGIAATVMSNLGLETFLEDIGIKLHRTAVGDRYVLEHMRENDLNIGGEQSGHIIFKDYSTSGDGLMAALQVLKVIVETVGKQPVSEICNVFEAVPQTLRSIRYESIIHIDDNPFKREIAKADKALKGRGRVLVRKSGTEPVIRIMAEGHDKELVKTVVEGLCNFVELCDKNKVKK